MATLTIFLDDECIRVNAGIAQIIFEQSQPLFTEKELESEPLYDLIHYLNAWLVVRWIDLDDLSIKDLRVFNQYCKQAMKNYPNTEDAKSKEKETLDYILRIWDEFLLLVNKKIENK